MGTGVLTNKIYEDSANIYGIDFSQRMLEIAQKKMPKARLIQWNFSLGLPPELENEKFDYIISLYAIHHVNDEKKLELIKKLKDMINADGKIIIADIGFETTGELLKCKEKNRSIWDDEEFYVVANEIIEKFKEHGIKSNYTQISSCAGVFEIFK